ncbi:MAG: winged helix-turn-helix domain-containing protein [Candidatus Methanofastidiosia archaeon]
MKHTESLKEKLIDGMTIGLLRRIVEAGRCTKEELYNSPEIAKESQKIIDNLEKNGLIEREQETVRITEKGRKVLRILNQLDILMKTNQ